MSFSLWFMFAALVIVAVQTDKLDPGPQTFIEKAPTEQKAQKRYATKEVVVYLTPSQINAIQEGKGYISAEPVDQVETSEENIEGNQEVLERQPEQEDSYVLSPHRTSSEEQQVSSIPVDEPNLEPIEEEPQFSWIYTPEEKKFFSSTEDAYAYWRYYPDTETQTEQTKLESRESEEETEQAKSETPQPQEQRFRLIPYEVATEKSVPSTTKASNEDPIRERWLRLLELNRSQLRKQLPPTLERTTATTTTTSEQPKADPETTFSKLRFSSRYNDQKQAIENEKRRKLQVEKQKSNRANKTPVVIRKEVTITKQQQVPLIKHIKVPTPVLVPIPEPFEVKVPHPFPVPLEIFRPISNSATKPKILENKQPVVPLRSEGEKSKKEVKKSLTPTEKTSVSESRVSIDGKKKVTFEEPSRQKGQPERITIIRHTWEN